MLLLASICGAKSTLDLFQGPALGLHYVASNVQSCKNAYGCKPQVYCGDSEPIHDAQEAETDDKIGNLRKRIQANVDIRG